VDQDGVVMICSAAFALSVRRMRKKRKRMCWVREFFKKRKEKEHTTHYWMLLLLLLLFTVCLTTLSQYLRRYSIDVGDKPAASAQFLLNPDSSVRAI
jgi:hypothetical protein